MKLVPPRWAALNLALAAAAGVLVLADLDAPPRAPLVLAFLLVSPGFALVRLLHLGDRVAELTLVLALSVALDAIVPGVLLYADLWSPPAGLVVLFAVVLLATLLETARPPRPTRV